MINKTLKHKHFILEASIIFIITLIFNLMCNTLVHDEVWVYGFSYNIATGLIPYKDFNMVITPLYPSIIALFMSIFGKNIIVCHIINAIVCTVIFYQLKQIAPKSCYIAYCLLLLFALPNYNLLCLLFLNILMSLESKKNNDYLIGIILGLAFLTKQNIGIYLCLPTLFTKKWQKIFKRIIGFLIPNIIFLIYLLYNDIFYQFIDYTILGISDFATKNTVIHPSCLIITIISIIFLIYKYIKTKDIKLIYLLCFQGMAYPLIDPYHVIIPFIPVINIFLSELKLNKKIIIVAFLVFIITIFIYNLHLYKTSDYSYPNTTNTYKYRKINNEVSNKINKLSYYIKNSKDDIYIIDMYAYLLKLEASIPINKYDLLNNGNLGKDGELKIINEIDNRCKKVKCTFLINEQEIGNKISQYNQDILRYVVNNYNHKENKDINTLGLSVYQNY